MVRLVNGGTEMQDGFKVTSKRWIVAGMSLAMSLPGCGASVGVDGNDEATEAEVSSLKNGTLVDGGGRWAGVVKLQILTAGSWAVCSGQISSRTTIVTAAHCVNYPLQPYSSGNIQVIVTRQTSTGQWQTLMPQTTAFAKYHPFYDGSAYRDVAVITLPSQLSGVVQADAVPLALNNQSGQSMWALGYGYYDVTSDDGLGRSGQITPTYSSANHEYTFSASSTQPQICSGDSGGPLKMFSSNRWLNFGVASWFDLDRSGWKCGHSGHWASVPDNSAWLMSAIGYDKCTQLLTFITCW